MEIQLQCLYSNHNNSQILGFCLNEDCCYQRGYCEICFYNLHSNHVNDLCSFNNLDMKIQQANITIDSLSKLLLSTKEQISKFIKFYLSTYSIKQQDFINISHQSINPAIDQIIAIKKLEKELIPMLENISLKLQPIAIKFQEISEYKNNQQKCRLQSKIVEPIDVIFLKTDDNIEISNQGKTVLKTNVGYQFVICDPVIPKQKRVSFAFEILSVGLRTAIGICHKDINTKTQQLKEGHGSYLMVNSGNCFENSKPKGTKTAFEFGQGSKILIEVDTIQKKIIWRNLDNKNEYFVNIDISKELYPCLRLGPKNQNEPSSVRILDQDQYFDDIGE